MFFLISMRIHILFYHTFNLDARFWHLSEKIVNTKPLACVKNVMSLGGNSLLIL